MLQLRRDSKLQIVQVCDQNEVVGGGSQADKIMSQLRQFQYDAFQKYADAANWVRVRAMKLVKRQRKAQLNVNLTVSEINRMNSAGGPSNMIKLNAERAIAPILDKPAVAQLFMDDLRDYLPDILAF